MAGQRKLLSEIDRTLKKVNEGVEVFNDIWDKVYAATAQNQKEKHEADLKKEIKKLQRLRDQIKTWINNSDIKDKSSLTDARQLIERKMEEFKVCEKETKTKAYSKEGLAQVERLDPADQARLNSQGWIQDCLTQLNAQIESVEVDIERLNSAKGKHKNKSEIAHLDSVLGRHKWHVLKLEQINRLLDNDQLNADQVDDLREDVEYYLEANQDPDFLETMADDDIYEPLDLDSIGPSMQVGPTGQEKEDEPVEAPPVEVKPAPVEKEKKTKAKKNASSSSLMSGIGRPGSVKPMELKKSQSTPSKTKDDCVEEKKSKKTKGTSPAPNGVTSTPSKKAPETPAKSPTSSSPPSAEAKPTELNFLTPVSKKEAPVTSPSTAADAVLGRTTSSDPSDSSASITPTLSARSQQPAPPLTEEQKNVLRMVDESFKFLPEPLDSDRSTRYTPKNAYPTHASFPTEPSSALENPSLFEKMDVDTLFFIFYYQQGSYQQYLAARELKRRTWGYHKKYKTWFKRHEEPQVTGDKYEQGTFVYFDYEAGWCQRIKPEFTFEYMYLEDELQ